MATVKKVDCECSRRTKASCWHKHWKVSYREPGNSAGELRELRFNFEADAEAFAVKVERDKDLGVAIDPGRGQRKFEEVWQEWVDFGELEESTVANYRSVYKNHYGPSLGAKAIGVISPVDIAAWAEDQQERGYKPYGIQTRRNILSSVFGYAVDAEIIGRNPCRRVNPRKKAKRSAYTPVAEEEIPSLEEVLGIIAEVPKPLRAAFWAMAGSGVRPGESLAISEPSVDWEAGTLLVNHQVSAYGVEKVTGSRRGWKRGTKHRLFEESRRAPVPEPVREALGGHIDTYGSWGTMQWLFESPRKSDAHPSYEWLLRKFRDAAKAAGVPHYTPKSLRHFFVSEAIHANIPTWEIAQWIGHRDTRTTEQVYGHLVKRSFRRCNTVMSDVLTRGLTSCHGVIPARELENDDADHL